MIIIPKQFTNPSMQKITFRENQDIRSFKNSKLQKKADLDCIRPTRYER